MADFSKTKQGARFTPHYNAAQATVSKSGSGEKQI